MVDEDKLIRHLREVGRDDLAERVENGKYEEISDDTDPKHEVRLQDSYGANVIRADDNK